MNRRALLKAAPALALVGAVPAVAAPADSLEMAALYERWSAAKEAYNKFDGLDEAKDAELESAISLVEDEILAIQPQTVKDYAFKVLVLNDFAGFDGLPWGDAMLAEARTLIGA
ncbi:hypothetical protein [Paracoccus sp. MC1862]|uniref:hypothetical protein n=1 Tax=Paracoccus sp. MC1862 TaxID=2760307 RepID=UPI001604464C|nr:hypothetical protein [Paracoccus sp. MC1862]MBB1498792.1 hypothetical protein [Paracoccus sp. MC1862]QQO43802.1 hypothetical protein JGR78_10210 [Paracoccus sp. MC1862]